jgi:hypothetical protein
MDSIVPVGGAERLRAAFHTARLWHVTNLNTRKIIIISICYLLTKNIGGLEKNNYPDKVRQVLLKLIE